MTAITTTANIITKSFLLGLILLPPNSYSKIALAAIPPIIIISAMIAIGERMFNAVKIHEA